jgi:hypothetical protein
MMVKGQVLSSDANLSSSALLSRATMSYPYGFDHSMDPVLFEGDFNPVNSNGSSNNVNPPLSPGIMRDHGNLTAQQQRSADFAQSMEHAGS